MTIRELYEAAKARGYEDARLCVEVEHTNRHTEIVCDFDDEINTTQVAYGGYFDFLTRIGDAIWIKIDIGEIEGE